MWIWKSATDKSGGMFLTGPIGTIAYIVPMKSRYECTASLPNGKAVSLCRDIAVPLKYVKQDVCKLAVELLTQCIKQLETDCLSVDDMV